jgi:hypothetical protein
VEALLDNTRDDPTERAPLVLGADDDLSITEKVCRIVEADKPPRAWYIAFGIAASLTGILGLLIAYLFAVGVGVWGLNRPVSWGFDITNFVFWVGIGHAGTLISAILYLFRQDWRTGINRFAEAMTIFAVICAGLFPLIHTGRPWLAWYWLLPYPNVMTLWPNFKSPLLWDILERAKVDQDRVYWILMARMEGSDRAFANRFGRSSRCHVSTNSRRQRIEWRRHGPPDANRRSTGDPGRFLLRQDHQNRTGGFVGAVCGFAAIGARTAPDAGFSGFDRSANQGGAGSIGRTDRQASNPPSRR